MGAAEEFGHRGRNFARRFLRTAVVVDDEAYMAFNVGDGPNDEVVAPARNSRASRQGDRDPVGRRTSRTLDAGTLIGSFSELGMICGVVAPTDAAMDTMRKADIVILDWRLQADEPEYALKLLRELLTGEAERNSLRLVAIYTGEAGLEDIHRNVFAMLKNCELEPEESGTGTEISYRHGRVVLYAKSDLITHNSQPV